MMTYEQFLLNKLAEEASEITKIALKATQFGLDDHHPESVTTNREEIHNEINDLLTIVRMLNDIGFDYQKLCYSSMKTKEDKVLKYLEYSRNAGYVEKNK